MHFFVNDAHRVSMLRSTERVIVEKALAAAKVTSVSLFKIASLS